MSEHEQNELPNSIDSIDTAIWDIELEQGQPHSHIEVVSQSNAELYEKASKDVGSVALRLLPLMSSEALKLAESEKLDVRSWPDFDKQGFVGVQVSTVANKDGEHPMDGTSEFYSKVKELEQAEQESPDAN